MHGAGRTDAGVHALGQVASFTLARAIDAGTVMRAAEQPAARRDSRRSPPKRSIPAFHARFAARTPRRIATGSWNGGVLDPFERTLRVARRRCARCGRHAGGGDRARRTARLRRVPGQRRDTKTTEREIVAITLSATEDTESTQVKPILRTQSLRDLRVPRDSEIGSSGGALITIEITGTGFLRHMVRIIVGSLVEIGRGRRDARWLARGAGGARSAAGGTDGAAAGAVPDAASAYGSTALADEP